MRLPDFSLLSPQDIADAAEAVLGERVDGTLTPYPSYINRVYGLRTEDCRRVVAKFYRPGRWTEAAIREEHSFVAECADAGLPVLMPIPDDTGETLHAVAIDSPDDETDERYYFFELCPFIQGRGWEPDNADDWIALGNVIASLHGVGSRKKAPSRLAIGPEQSSRPALSRLFTEEVIHPDIRSEFEDVCASALETISSRFEGYEPIRIHGDLHRGNLLTSELAVGAPWRNGQRAAPILIDFDDMANGPAVQDLWLFLPGRLSESRAELNLLLEGYEEIRTFDRSTTELIEPLRFMRMLGYLDWQARQRADAGFARAIPDWGGKAFWIKELEDLRDQARVIEEESASISPP